MKNVFKNCQKRSIFDEQNEYPISKTLKTEVIVIGAGVMGSTIAQSFRHIGKEVLVIDKADPEAGSIPCGGLMKPSKFTELNETEYNRVVGVLDSLFTMKKEEIIIKPSGNLLKVDIRNVSMDDIFGIKKTIAEVVEMDTEKAECIFKKDGKYFLAKADLMVLALGAGGSTLTPLLFEKGGLIAKRGFSFHFEGHHVHNFVKFWAPYKQVTIHNTIYQGQKITWAGDGSALTLPSWYEGRIDEAYKRIMAELPEGLTLLRTVRGLRCFHRKAKPCFLEHRGKTWVASGAGKMGLISAGFSALHLLEKEFGVKKLK